MTDLVIVAVLLTAVLGLAVIDIMGLEERNRVLEDQLNESKQRIKERDAIIDLFTDIRDQRDIYKRFLFQSYYWCIINQKEREDNYVYQNIEMQKLWSDDGS